MADALPNRKQARILVASLAIFWGSWGIAFASFSSVPAVGAAAAIVGLVFGYRFWLTLYRIWDPESKEPSWRMILWPRFRLHRTHLARHLFDLLSPSWIKHTLRETGGNPRVAGFGLLALLAADFVVCAPVSSALPRR